MEETRAQSGLIFPVNWHLRSKYPRFDFAIAGTRGANLKNPRCPFSSASDNDQAQRYADNTWSASTTVDRVQSIGHHRTRPEALSNIKKHGNNETEIKGHNANQSMILSEHTSPQRLLSNVNERRERVEEYSTRSTKNNDVAQLSRLQADEGHRT